LKMKLIAKTKDGDIFEVKAQRMFPNCKTRYTKCCYDDKEFWEKYEAKVKTLLHYKPPEGFDKW